MRKQIFSLLMMATLIIIFVASCGSRGADRREDVTASVIEAEPTPSPALVPEPTPSPEPTPELEEEPEILPITLQDALTRANERRENIIRREYTEVLSIIEGHTPSIENLYNFIQPRQRVTTVDIEDAIADIEDFFEFMRDMYAGYLVFGGDEVFLPIKDAVIEEITALGASVTTGAMVRILHERLSPVIVDGHFFLSNFNFGRDINFYVSDARFDRTAAGFRNRENGLYVATVDGVPVGELMQLFLNEYGVFYYAVTIPQELSTWFITSTITYTNGISEELRLDIMPPITHRAFQPTSLEFIHGIPVVTKRAMTSESLMNVWSTDVTHIEQTNLFLSFAEELRDEPVVIVDLRGNLGGSGILVQRWLYALTGELVRSTSSGFSFEMAVVDVYVPTPEGTTWYHSEETSEWIFQNASFKSYGSYTISYSMPDTLIQREQLLIVLVDRRSASASEIFVHGATNITNTLIIGTNTFGAANFGGTGFQKFMPHTGIPFGFGFTAVLFPEGHLPESVGLTPDIWVKGDALAAALAMLEAWEVF